MFAFAKCAVASDVQVAQSHTELQMVGGDSGLGGLSWTVDCTTELPPHGVIHHLEFWIA